MEKGKTLDDLGEKIDQIFMRNLKKFFKKKRVLITGHTGFKGSWLSQILINWGANITGVALRPNTRPNLFGILKLDRKLNNYFVDIRNFKKIKEILRKEKPEIIFHLAAQPIVRKSYEDPIYTFETNIIGTVNILQAIKEIGGVKSVVLITTDKVYENKEKGRPYKENDKLGGHDPYSSSKAGAEIVIDSYIKSFFNPKDYKKHKTLVASARSGNVIGGGDWSQDRLVPDVVKAIFETNRKIIIRNPDSVRPWQFVLEPIQGYLLLAKKLYEGKNDFSGGWNFGPDKNDHLNVRGVVEKVIKILKKGSYIIKKDREKYEVKLLRLSSSKARKMLGWRSIFDIDQALEFTLDWYRGLYNKENIIALTNKEIEAFFNHKYAL